VARCGPLSQLLYCTVQCPCLQTGAPAQQDIKRLGLTCHTLAPDLMSAYNGDFGDLLRDDAAAALMSSRKDKVVANGYSLEANPILQAFAEVRSTLPRCGPHRCHNYRQQCHNYGKCLV